MDGTTQDNMLVNIFFKWGRIGGAITFYQIPLTSLWMTYFGLSCFCTKFRNGVYADLMYQISMHLILCVIPLDEVICASSLNSSQSIGLQLVQTLGGSVHFREKQSNIHIFILFIDIALLCGFLSSRYRAVVWDPFQSTHIVVSSFLHDCFSPTVQ